MGHIELVLDLLTISQGDGSFVKKVLAKPGITSMRELALNSEDVSELLPSVKLRDQLLAKVYAAEPTAVLQRQLEAGTLLETSSLENQQNAAKILSAIPRFDITTQTIRTIHDEAKNQLPNASHDAISSALACLETTQRLQAVSKSAKQVTVLSKSGFVSATQIAKVPSADFAKKLLSQGVTENEALHIHKSATLIRSRNQQALVNLFHNNSSSGLRAVDASLRFPSSETEVKSAKLAANKAFSAATMPILTTSAAITPVSSHVIAAVQSDTGNLPQHLETDGNQVQINLDSLFGDSMTANCDDCNSVTSPAAYFVDLLRLLKNSGTPDGKSVLDKLLERRPDLKTLQLSCANTNVELPYIDLVNEVLEAYVTGSFSSQPSYNVTDMDQSQDLIMEPHNVNQGAYAALKSAIFMPLPYDKDIDGVRSFTTILGTSRADVIEGFCSPTELPHGASADDAIAAKQTALVAERLSLLQEEYYAMTGNSFWHSNPPNKSSRPYYKYWGFEDETSFESLVTGLHRVKQTFLPKTGCSYEQLLEILKTTFINPILSQMSATELGFYEATGSSMKDLLVQLPAAGSAHSALLTLAKSIAVPHQFTDKFFNGKDESEVSSFVARWLEKFGEKVKRLIVLQITASAELDVNTVSLVLSDGSKLQQSDWQRLWTLIRLWRNCDGWSLTDVSDALVLSGSLNIDTGMPSADTLVQLLAIKDITQLLQANVSNVLPLWASFGTTGPGSLYERIFLQPRYSTVAKNKSIFEPDQTGTIFNDPGLSSAEYLRQHLAEYLTQLAAFLGVNQEELTALRSLLGPTNEVISLPTLAKLCQYGTLANLLDIPQTLLPAFFAVFPDSLRTPEATYSALKKWNSLQNTGVTLEQLCYIATGRDYSKDSLAPSLSLATEVTKSLLTQLSEIQIAFPDTGSLEQPKDDLVLQSLAKLFGVTIAGDVLSFVNGEKVLVKVVLNPAPAITDTGNSSLAQLSSKLNYDVLEDGSASLQITGILTSDEKVAAKAISPSTSAWVDAIESVETAAQAYITQTLGLVLDGADQSQASILLSADEKGSQISKQSALLSIYQPFMRKYLWKEAVSDAVSGLFDLLDPTIIRYIANDMILVNDRTTVSEFLSSLGNNSNSLASSSHVYLIPQTSDLYTFSISGSTATNQTMSIDGFPISFPQNEGIRLAQGQPYDLVATNIPIAQIMWQTTRSGPTLIPESNYVSETAVSSTMTILIILKRLSLILETVNLSQDELLYFDKIPKESIKFSSLDLTSVQSLYTYVTLRQSLTSISSNLSPLLDLFKWAGNAARIGSLSAKISDVTGWSESLVAELLKVQYGWFDSDISLVAHFTDATALSEMQSLVKTATKLGLTGDALNIEALCHWAQSSPLDSNDNGRDFQFLSSLKVYALSTVGADVVGQVNDNLRGRARDALVAWILHQPSSITAGIFDPDSLFEYILIDVQMNAGLNTSRIKQALSTVQLFGQRCLMNLEHGNGIPTTAINTERWEWMQSYPLWAANRQVFLYPENWLDPSLRDDKSELFTDFEAAVSTKDLGADSIEEAIKSYVFSLVEIANLQPVALYQENAGAAGSIVHCFASSWHAPYVYFHRTWDGTFGTWTPWQRLDVDIPLYDTDADGKPLAKYGSFIIPYRLQGRLYVFLPRFTLKTKDVAFKNSDQTDTKFNQLGDSAVKQARPAKYWEIKIGVVEYRSERWTTVKTSGLTVTDDTPKGFIENLNKGSQTLPALEFNHDVCSGMTDGTPPDLGSYRFWAGPGHSSSSIFLDITRSHKCLSTKAEGILSVHRFPVARLTFFSGSFSPQVEPGAQTSGEVGPLAFNQRFEFEGWNASFSKVFGETSKRGVLFDVVAFQDYYNSQHTFMPKMPGNYILSVEETASDADIGTAGTFYQLSNGATKQNGVPLYSFAPYSLVKAIAPPGIQAVYSLIANRDPGNSMSTALNNQDQGTSNVASGNGGAVSPSAPGSGGPPVDSGSGNTTTTAPRPYDPTFQFDFGMVINGGSSTYHELRSPSAIYLAELGLHIPMLLVDRLLSSQQFDLAIQYCRLIFDPLADGIDESRCWLWPPFKRLSSKEVKASIIGGLTPSSGSETGMNTAILEWRENPFKPHVIARDRPQAYMKWIVMKYIEILVAKGDYYFRQNTLESVPLAIQSYVLASHIYGPRVEIIPPLGSTQIETYSTLESKLDDFSDALVNMELQFPYTITADALGSISSIGISAVSSIYTQATTKYFCIGANPQIKALGDTIDDRLFKIRHSMDINGVVRRLALFEPPLDPGILIKAVAGGLNPSSVINDLDSPMPNYRFYYLLQKALELCSELRQLGNSFLASKEKGDGERLASLRAKQESIVNATIKDLKTLQLSEASKSLEALQESRRGPVTRMSFYLKLAGESTSKIPNNTSDYDEIDPGIQAPTKDDLRMNPSEKLEMEKYEEASKWNFRAGILDQTASYLMMLPELMEQIMPLGAGVTLKVDGSNVARALQAVAGSLRMQAEVSNQKAASAGRKSMMIRQLQERRLQANLAGREIKALDKQIETQKVRIDMAKQDIILQEKQIQNSSQIEDYLRTKYSNTELYTYLSNSTKSLYYQTYQVAYDIAKRAEKAFHFERGSDDSNYIQYGYWDSSRDGLMAAEGLYVGLKRLEMAYMENRPHDFELTKHISLRSISPMGLLQLRTAGMVEFSLPEVLFDMDFPGHYSRRIKSVSISIPCVVGPYASINCTLRLLSHCYRTSSVAKNKTEYPESLKVNDPRFRTSVIPISSIAASTGQNDAGVFDLNFKDERYIPFEGAGAISKWRLELPSKFRQFDYESISDVLLHMKYTSRDGGSAFGSLAADVVTDFVKKAGSTNGLVILFDLKNDFPTEWYRFANLPVVPPEGKRELALAQLQDRLPFFARGSLTKPVPTQVTIISSSDLGAASQLGLILGAAAETPFTAVKNAADYFAYDLQIQGSNAEFGTWKYTLQGQTVLPLDRMWMLVSYHL